MDRDESTNQPPLTESDGPARGDSGQTNSRSLNPGHTESGPALQLSALLGAAFQSLPNTVVITDNKGCIQWVNPAFTRCTGYTPNEALGNTPRILRSGKQDKQFYKKLWDTILAGEVWQGDLINRHKNGSLYHEEMSITPVRSADGSVTNFVALKHDVTLRKTDEEQARQYTLQLERTRAEQQRDARRLAKLIDDIRRSEMSFRVLFNGIPQPVYVFDRDTLLFLEVNETATKSYAYSRDELLGMKIIDLRPPDEIPRMLEILKREGPVSLVNAPFKHRTRDGRMLDLEVSAHSLEFAGKNAVLSVAIDVTEKKRLEMELRHNQKIQDVGRLASGIAHEINTPIQFVGDNLRFLRDEFGGIQSLLTKYGQLQKAAELGPVPPPLLQEVREAYESCDMDYLLGEVPKAMNQSLDGVERVASIVRAMKEFSHPDCGEKVSSDINNGLRTTLIVARNELKYVADVETSFGDLPPVPCYPGSLNQVFLNLLVNAAHAIQDVVKSTGQKGKIKVSTRAENRWVVIDISDTGAGIPENIRNRIFEPFFTTKETGRGTGQGLALARSIVIDKHGGTVSFESQIGVGTTFTIRLPIEGPDNKP